MSPNYHCNDNENQNDFSVGTVSNTSKTHDSITILTLCILILRHPAKVFNHVDRIILE